MVTLVGGLLVFSVLLLDVAAQVPGTGGAPCRPSTPACLDRNQQICDNNVCRIRQGNNCGNNPQICVTGATCKNSVCVCDTAPLDNGLCAPRAVTTSPATSTRSTTKGLQERNTTTEHPNQSTTPSGSSHLGESFLTMVTQVCGTVICLLCVLYCG